MGCVALVYWGTPVNAAVDKFRWWGLGGNTMPLSDAAPGDRDLPGGVLEPVVPPEYRLPALVEELSVADLGVEEVWCDTGKGKGGVRARDGSETWRLGNALLADTSGCKREGVSFKGGAGGL